MILPSRLATEQRNPLRDGTAVIPACVLLIAIQLIWMELHPVVPWLLLSSGGVVIGLLTLPLSTRLGAMILASGNGTFAAGIVVQCSEGNPPIGIGIGAALLVSMMGYAALTGMERLLRDHAIGTEAVRLSGKTNRINTSSKATRYDNK